MQLTDTEGMTLAFAFIFPLSMLIYSNSRVTEAKETLRSEIAKLGTELRREMKDIRGEIKDLRDDMELLRRATGTRAFNASKQLSRFTFWNTTLNPTVTPLVRRLASQSR